MSLFIDNQGFINTTPFYGFGNDSEGHAEPVLSGRLV